MLLINGYVLPGKGSWTGTSKGFEIHIMSHGATLEGTEKQWNPLIGGTECSVKLSWSGEVAPPDWSGTEWLK